MSKFKRPLMITAAVSSLALAGIVPTALARHGADDPAGHDAGDDHGGKVTVRAHAARHGADDRAGDDRGAKRLRVRAARHGAIDDHGGHGHGTDDGPGHR